MRLFTAKGNPHIHPGPQIADPDLVDSDYLGANGITDETMVLSELARNTEATLALAFEQRTANLIAIHQYSNDMVANGMQVNAAGRARLDGIAEDINDRLGLNIQGAS